MNPSPTLLTLFMAGVIGLLFHELVMEIRWAKKASNFSVERYKRKGR